MTDHLQSHRSDPSSDVPTTGDLREELRVGVRMIQALDAQLKRAESVIRREDEARRRADEAIQRLEALMGSIDLEGTTSGSPGVPEIQDATGEAIDRISRVGEEAAHSLNRRLDGLASLDSRFDELDATVRTLERRLERLATTSADSQADRGSTSSPTSPNHLAPTLTTTSGSLSIEPRSTPPRGTRPTPVEALVRTSLMVDRAEEIRRELRKDLAAICTASGTLADVVEQAAESERRLDERIAAAGKASIDAGNTDGDQVGATVVSILRGLADELDLARSTTRDGTTDRPESPSGRAAMPPIRPIELDLDSSPDDSGRTIPRREPLAPAGDPATSIEE